MKIAGIIGLMAFFILTMACGGTAAGSKEDGVDTDYSSLSSVTLVVSTIY